MPDFPVGAYWVPRNGITSVGGSTELQINALGSNQVAAGATWPAANRALYIAFYTDVPLLVQKISVQVTTTDAAGHFDVGIYDEKGTRLVSSGSTAVQNPAALQVFDITDTRLNPGTYWIAMNSDGTTAAVTRIVTTSVELLRVFGVQQQAVGAVTLPATASFSNAASAYVPVINLQCCATL